MKPFFHSFIRSSSLNWFPLPIAVALSRSAFYLDNKNHLIVTNARWIYFYLIIYTLFLSLSPREVESNAAEDKRMEN